MSLIIENLQNEFETPARSTRTRVQPQRFKDFLVNLPPSVSHQQPDTNQESSTVHPISNFISYKNFSKKHKCFLAAITSNNEHVSFSQAAKDPRWHDAMKTEIKALTSNNTWELVELPKGKGRLIASGFTRSNSILTGPWKGTKRG